MQDILEDTERLWRDGRYLDAWARLDDLHPEETCEPQAIAMVLRLMPQVGELANWKHGNGLAHLLETSSDEDFRISAAEWRVEYAVKLLEIGKRDLAREQLERAFDAWLPIRLAVIDDDRLADLI